MQVSKEKEEIGVGLILKLFYDGSHFEGIAKVGYVIQNANTRKIIAEVEQLVGFGDNNFAEFSALKLGLEHCDRLGADSVITLGDSMVVINIMNGHGRTSALGLLQCMVAVESVAIDMIVSYLKIERNRGLHSRADRLSKITDGERETLRLRKHGKSRRKNN